MTRVVAMLLVGEEALLEGYVCDCGRYAVANRDLENVNRLRVSRSPVLKLYPAQSPFHAIIKDHLDYRYGKRQRRKKP